ncbi:F-box/kelch-repeat protein-like protein [Tanacetum coccineum]
MILHQCNTLGRGIHFICTLHSEGQLSSCLGYTHITPLEYPLTNYRIVGSCNGILCLFEWDQNGIKLWNPSIRQLLDVHDSPSLSHHGVFYLPLVGFGYDPTIDDYKIVKITECHTKTAIVLNSFVYTIKTATWCEIASPTPIYNSIKTTCPYLFNGTLNWVVKRYLSGRLCVGPGYCYLMTFDLSTQVFGTIMLPEPNWRTVQVTRIKGCLGVISSKHGTTCIWVRRKDDNTPYWSLDFKFDTYKFNGVQTALQLTDDGDLLYSTSEGVQAYNSNETKLQLKLAKYPDSSLISNMFVCVESLGLLDMEGSQQTFHRGKKRGRSDEIME